MVDVRGDKNRRLNQDSVRYAARARAGVDETSQQVKVTLIEKTGG